MLIVMSLSQRLTFQQVMTLQAKPAVLSCICSSVFLQAHDHAAATQHMQNARQPCQLPHTFLCIMLPFKPLLVALTGPVVVLMSAELVCKC